MCELACMAQVFVFGEAVKTISVVAVPAMRYVVGVTGLTVMSWLAQFFPAPARAGAAGTAICPKVLRSSVLKASRILVRFRMRAGTRFNGSMGYRPPWL